MMNTMRQNQIQLTGLRKNKMKREKKESQVNTLTAEVEEYKSSIQTMGSTIAELSKEHGDRPRERFPSAALTQSAVSNWLASKSQPLVGLFNSDTKERYVGR